MYVWYVVLSIYLLTHLYLCSHPESFGRSSTARRDVHVIKPDVDQRRERSAHAPLFAFPAVGPRRQAVAGDAQHHRVPLAVEHRNTLHLEDVERPRGEATAWVEQLETAVL